MKQTIELAEWSIPAEVWAEIESLAAVGRSGHEV